jgi:hypothetical protein
MKLGQTLILITTALMLAVSSPNAAGYSSWINGENYTGRCIPVAREFAKDMYGMDKGRKREPEKEVMFCEAFAAAVAEMTDKACIPEGVFVMELVDVGAMFIGKYFSDYGSKPAVSGLTAAFHAKWPCP